MIFLKYSYKEFKAFVKRATMKRGRDVDPTPTQTKVVFPIDIDIEKRSRKIVKMVKKEGKKTVKKSIKKTDVENTPFRLPNGFLFIKPDPINDGREIKIQELIYQTIISKNGVQNSSSTYDISVKLPKMLYDKIPYHFLVDQDGDPVFCRNPDTGVKTILGLTEPSITFNWFGSTFKINIKRKNLPTSVKFGNERFRFVFYFAEADYYLFTTPVWISSKQPRKGKKEIKTTKRVRGPPPSRFIYMNNKVAYKAVEEYQFGTALTDKSALADIYTKVDIPTDTLPFDGIDLLSTDVKETEDETDVTDVKETKDKTEDKTENKVDAAFPPFYSTEIDFSKLAPIDPDIFLNLN